MDANYRQEELDNEAGLEYNLRWMWSIITPVLRNPHWLPVQYRIIFKALLLVYKGLNGLAPAYISGLLHYRTSSRSSRASSQRLLSIPRTSLKTYGDIAFSAGDPRLWNELPLSLRSSNTLTVFKKDLKTYFFKFAFSLQFIF